ncbi:MAG: L,D-transpeptidase [Anaerolineae bacterium]|nr:L,D-transpeptidase [Anaerolineae bacterium]
MTWLRPLILVLLLLLLVQPARAMEPCPPDTPCVNAETAMKVAAGQAPNAANLKGAFVDWVSLDVRTYTQDAPNGRRLQLMYPQGTWFSVRDRKVVDGDLWYQTASGRWVYADDTSMWEPSALHGYLFKGNEQGQLGFIIEDDTAVLPQPNYAARPTHTLARYTPVGVLGRDNGYLRIAPGQWVAPSQVRLVTPVARPAEVGPEDRWIEVNLKAQTVAAYEGDKMIFATLTSTGKDPTPTITGVFYIYEKKLSEFMAGGWADHDPYILEEVPWTMYFTQRYALHGAYWHDEYGEVRSHGCVNLTPDDARFLFVWSGPVVPPGETTVKSSPTNLGTWVYVHE